MRYKAKVLARFPNATPVVVEQWPDGTPRHVQIWVKRDQPTASLDIHDRYDQQGHTAAWRSAYYWMVRNPQRTEEDAAMERRYAGSTVSRDPR